MCSTKPEEDRNRYDADKYSESMANAVDARPAMTESEEEAESRALMDVVSAFVFYKIYILNTCIYRRLRHIDELDTEQRQIVSDLGVIDKIKHAESLIRENYKFILDIARSNSVVEIPDPHEHPDEVRSWSKAFQAARIKKCQPAVEDHHMEKLLSTLKQFVRDWSDEGKAERDCTYTPILDQLDSEFASVSAKERGKLKVLVPGAGLGRLAHEIACRGFSCQGNEFSYFMLFASNFVLNKCTEKRQFSIYPFIHQFSNVASADDQLREVRIPDIVPGDMPYMETADFSMTAGDFIEIYGAPDEAEQWDAIVTCFFIDTAKNVMQYLKTMWNAMKPGAVWINMGPLLWHFDNVKDESSIEFTLEEFLVLVEKVGFVIDRSKFKDDLPVTYTANSRSMLQYTYHTFFAVAYKPK